MRIDAHQHYWSLARADYGWLTPALEPLYRDFKPEHLTRTLAAHGIAGTVLVQAAPTLAETQWLLELAAQTPSVLGVVGWVDLTAADASVQLETLARDPKFKGVRPMLQDLADDEWIADAPIEPALRRLASLGLSFDALVRPQHLAPLLDRLQQHPELAVVIDHAAKPRIGSSADWRFWRDALAPLARLPQVCVKLSGLLTEAPPGSGVDVLQPTVNAVLELFGPRRVMWGSDWPVLELAATYDDWVALSGRLLARLDAEDRAAVLGGTACRFYRLTDRVPLPTTKETSP